MSTSPTHEFIWPVRVYYEDTDSGGIVYYANYLKFIERARTEWLRQLGFEQTQLQQRDQTLFVVKRMTIDYFKPALFNDLLHITTTLTQLRKASMVLTQTVQRQTEDLCISVVQVACVNTITQKPHPFPPELFKVLQTQL